ncbi:hypothetical protein PoB_002102400 [Plakobranchus ocellatus]|uniref:Uncharacterized protein n=1 Tax=Plakobranchus ocellatus TaxID=259542 RepID=A0AAV3ZJE5_9GAST|nr:hypothetical protein PoB_002102400 [Plakobranchus ocellatus]
MTFYNMARITPIFSLAGPLCEMAELALESASNWFSSHGNISAECVYDLFTLHRQFFRPPDQTIVLAIYSHRVASSPALQARPSSQPFIPTESPILPHS